MSTTPSGCAKRASRFRWRNRCSPRRRSGPDGALDTAETVDSSHDRRRAPRQTVELEAELHLSGQSVLQGTVHDLSRVGVLFVPLSRTEAKPGTEGMLRISLPSGHLELPLRVARVTDIQLSSIPSVRGIGIEFGQLRNEQQRAVEALLEHHA